MKVLLSGASGFIGQNCISSWDVELLPIYRNQYIKQKIVSQPFITIETIDGDTHWNLDGLNIDVVIHAAGLAHGKFNRDTIESVNVQGTLNLALSAVKSGIKRFVFLSSIGVNGSSSMGAVYAFNSRPSPHNYYAQSKYDAEVGLRLIAERTGLEVVIVRPTLVYGANAPGNFGLLTKLVHRLPVLPFGLVNNKRDFIYVKNLADLLITCANHPDAVGHTFLASDGETVSIKEFTNAIAKGLDKRLIQLPIPISLMKLAGKLLGKSAMVDQLVGNLQVDSSNLKDVLGWTPPYTLEQAMASLSEKTK